MKAKRILLILCCAFLLFGCTKKENITTEEATAGITVAESNVEESIVVEEPKYEELDSESILKKIFDISKNNFDVTIKNKEHIIKFIAEEVDENLVYILTSLQEKEEVIDIKDYSHSEIEINEEIVPITIYNNTENEECYYKAEQWVQTDLKINSIIKLLKYVKENITDVKVSCEPFENMEGAEYEGSGIIKNLSLLTYPACYETNKNTCKVEFSITINDKLNKTKINYIKIEDKDLILTIENFKTIIQTSTIYSEVINNLFKEDVIEETPEPAAEEIIEEVIQPVNNGRMIFIGDSRTIDMFADSDAEIINEDHNGIIVFAKHGNGYGYLERVINDYGIQNFDTLIAWMGANDDGNFAKYEQFYNSLLANGKRIIVCTVGPTLDNCLQYWDIPKYENNRMTNYNSQLINWAILNNIEVIDLYTYIQQNVLIDGADGIHYLPRPNPVLWEYIVNQIIN